MIAVDTSVAVAAFGDWHRRNPEACAVLDEGAALPAHALLETYAVLTGFPPPHRAAPGLVDEWVADRFSTVLEPRRRANSATSCTSWPPATGPAAPSTTLSWR